LSVQHQDHMDEQSGVSAASVNSPA
jgi:hypothetical protein